MNDSGINILFYGDSNTWGFNPETGMRYPYETRWTTICSRCLGESCHCFPAGMNGRMTVFDDPVKGSRNGRTGLDYELQTHKPLDLAVVMLGTNDLKQTDAAGSREGITIVLRDILTANERYSLSSPVFPNRPKVLLISPARITGKEWFGEAVDAEAESAKFAGYYQDVTEQLKAEFKENAEIFFLDAAKITTPSEIDGVHLSAEGHRLLGLAVAEKIKCIFHKQG